MENLIRHIEFLLLRHDCVVLPGIGAFINVRHSARYDESLGAWRPMSREVRFNKAISHDDGLLANSYARKEQISFQEAREMLRHALGQMRSQLEEDGEITLGELGILSSEEGVLRFTPRLSAPVMMETLGYQPVSIEGFAAVADDKKPGAAPEEKPNDHLDEAAAETISAGIPEEEDVEETGELNRRFDTARNYYIAINKRFARVAACLMVLTFATLAIILPNDSRTRQDQASVMPVKNVEGMIRDTARRITEIAENGENEIAEAPAKTVAEAAPEGKDEYYLIVATFRTPDEAAKYASQNAGNGYTLEVVNTKTMSRVSAMSSPNREEMLKTLNSEDFRNRFSQAWIWKDEKR